jgi:hypothetical protein
MSDKKTPKIGEGKPGPGRPKGMPNKTTALLKDAILKAAEDAGEGDMAAYLTQQAKENPGPFMALLGKVLPMQIAGDAENPLVLNVTYGGK